MAIPDSAKPINLNLKVSGIDKKGFEQAAEFAGLSVSAWIRTRLRAAAVAEVGESSPFFVRPREIADSLAS